MDGFLPHSVKFDGTQNTLEGMTDGRATVFLALMHESRILGQLSNTVCGFSMMEQVRLCAVWPTETWLASSMNHTLGLMTV